MPVEISEKPQVAVPEVKRSPLRLFAGKLKGATINRYWKAHGKVNEIRCRTEQFWRNPGFSLYKRGNTRKIYKSVCDFMNAGDLSALERMRKHLPAVSPTLKLDREVGLKKLSPSEAPETTKALVIRCQQIIAESAGKRKPRADKPQFTSMLTPAEIAENPEFIRFALDKTILAAVADYLGAYPILTQAVLWHSHFTGKPPGNSQLYHRDHEDIRQIKIFVAISDIDLESGPLTGVNAQLSNRICNTLNYTCTERIKDEVIYSHLSKDDEFVYTGEPGTVGFIDTSNCLHFGSRIKGKDRFVAVFQYLSLTNFIMSPHSKHRKYPYAHLWRPHLSKIEQAALIGNANPNEISLEAPAIGPSYI